MSEELDEAWAAADEFELLWLRAREGARGARKGLERLQARVRKMAEEYRTLRLELANAWSKSMRLESENRSLKNKVERLSLRIIESWGKEAEDGQEG